MIVLWVALFFALAIVVAWLLLFPAAYEALSALCRRAWRALSGTSADVGKRAAHWGQRSGSTAHASGTRFASGLRRHRLVLIASIALLSVPPLTILLLRQNVALDGYSDADQTPTNPLIAELLRGERLIPPRPPPPDVFTTAEVRRVKPELVTADRKWDRLDTDIQQRVLAVYRVMREQYGYEMVLTEGYRSPERQASLPSTVTRAGAWQSCHQYGLAVDSAVFRDGKLQWDLEDDWVRRGYELYGELSTQANLEWGGNWRSIKDYPHVEKTAACAAAKKARRESLKKAA